MHGETYGWPLAAALSCYLGCGVKVGVYSMATREVPSLYEINSNRIALLHSAYAGERRRLR